MEISVEMILGLLNLFFTLLKKAIGLLNKAGTDEADPIIRED